MKNCAAAAALAAMLLAVPAGGAALETTPLVPGAQAAPQEMERIPAFGRNRGFMGVSASDKRLKQARVGGVCINLRVHTPMGEEITFHENLGPASEGQGAICLSTIASSNEEALVLQIDQEAIDLLRRVNVTEIVVANGKRDVCGYYRVDDLEAVRAALGLAEKELLCVSGDEDPITVVSEDGVRRMVTQ